MSAQRQSGGGGNAEGIALGIGAVALLAVVLDLWAAAHLAARFNHGAKAAQNPFTMLSDLVHHSYTWPKAATWWACGIAVCVALLGTVVGVVIYRRTIGGRGIDRSARNVTRDPGVKRYAANNKVKRAPGVFSGPGPVIGKVVNTKRMLRASWEDMLVLIAGPRTGKTTSYAIPAIMDAPGAVLVTSNKRDIVDGTRGPRELQGHCWVFDPQGVAGAGASWWWDPVSYVTDVRSARKLAAVWSNASKEPEARADAYFDNAGQELLAQLLLAAAEGHRAISAVFNWLSDSEDDTPVGLLSEAGHPMSADSLRATINLPDKQKAGVYGTASKIVSFLADPRVLEWVEDQGRGARQFHPAEFVESTDTLYSLSREGEGSSGPLVTALTAAVLEAAETKAAASFGGRLGVPMLAALDEVANVCRWRELPDLYSHYGSRGIVVLAILQSWAQGVSCWGEQGMQKLWDAANVKVYGGGTTDTRFLESLSQLFGHYDRRMQSGSQSAQGNSTSWSSTRERVFSVDDLASMPPGRAAVGLSGTHPVLVETMAWMQRPDADAVEASMARYGTPDGHYTAAGTTDPAKQVAS